VIFLGLLLVGFLLPVLSVILRAFRAGVGDPTSVFQGDLWRITRFTYLQAGISSLAAGAIGIPIAFVLHDRSERWARLCWYATLLPFSVPGLLYALSFIGTWHAYGLVPILVAHTFLNFPIYVRWVGLALQRDGESLERAALALGASRWQCFCKITWPRIRAACAASFFLSFLYCASSFIVVLTLGGNPRFTTLEVALYESIRMLFDINRASLFALIQLAAFSLIFLINILLKPSRVVGRPLPTVFPSVYRARSKPVAIASWGAIGTGLALLCAPLGHLLIAGLVGLPKISLAEWVSLITKSLLLGLGTAVFGIVLSFGAAYVAERTRSRAIAISINVLTSLPLAVSSLVLGLGILI